ncbi:MAG: alpha/beta hydrolase family protein [Planctomycetota bacterium]
MNTKLKDLIKAKEIELILVSGMVLLCSCVHYKCDPDYAGPSERSAELLEYYSYPRQKIEAEVVKIDEKKHYVVEEIEFPSALNVFGTENIKLEFYVQKKPGKFPTVLVLPISGGIDFSVRGFARLFASNGFNCAVVHNRHVDLDDTKTAEEVENYFRQTVLDNRQILDYLVEREQVDSDRLGCLGLSLGGIRASMIAGVDERLKCTVIGLAGGSIADINLLSDKKEIREYKEELIEMGISSEIIHTELSDKVITDPLKLAQYTDAGGVLMFTAMFDRVIPRKCSDQLWQAMGKPEVVYLLSGHYSSFLYLPYAERKSLSFFKDKFEIR